jgi:predicted kinase
VELQAATLRAIRAMDKEESVDCAPSLWEGLALFCQPGSVFMEAEERKTLHFLVGAPGSGKSTVTSQHPDAHVASSDKHPGLYTPSKTPGGVPDIDFKKLPEAHAAAQKSAADAMASGHPHVIVDNTNTAAWQVKPYLHHAAKHGYDVKFTHVTAPLDQIRARGKHFPREKPAEGQPDRLAAMKTDADGFAAKLKSLQKHPAPMKALDQEGAFKAPWEKEHDDNSALHGLKYSIHTVDTTEK